MKPPSRPTVRVVSAEEIVAAAAPHAGAELLGAALKTIGASSRCASCGATVCLVMLGGESFALDRRMKRDTDGDYFVPIHHCHREETHP